MNRYIWSILILMMAIMGCKKPYLPPAVASDQSYLVVEGVINPGPDSTIIHLSHTVPVSALTGTMPPPELNANVLVESDVNTSYPLAQTGNGYYIAVGLNLNPNNKYRLRITTSGNKVYQSDFVPVKNAQPIDSVSYQFKSDGVQININTHDASNNTRYYRWDYSETWIIHADYQSSLMLITSPVDSIVDRPQSNQIYRCWQSAQSSNIVLSSTAKLSNDVVVNSPVTFLASNSEKLTERYSILVKQYAMTADAFNYYQQLKKNTEQLGGIFDPQPTTLTGNVHCITNSSEIVIGYLTAGTFSQKRIYIGRNHLPAGLQWFPLTPYSNCLQTVDYYHNPETGINDVAQNLYTGIQIPINPLQLPGQLHPYAYTASSGICVDCTLRGTNIPPSFWIDE